MIKQITQRITLVTAAILLALAVGSSASASPTGGEGGTLFLSVTFDDGTIATQTLDCQSDSSDHPAAQTSCEQLAEAGGTIADIQPASFACTLELRPAQFRAIGFWDGQIVSYEDEFPNPCVGDRDTGGNLFSFI
ncbi:SSI family serine proteinase inhibitor [Salininema proteolyticum]|uniref:SSI family serine proteinase inhibitor n=1 Tax=Salininema proteolyticum TaxID=1607685 RepID=A0ABV8TZU5_9ACTN